MNLGNNNVNIHMTFELCYEEGITALICQKKNLSHQSLQLYSFPPK